METAGSIGNLLAQRGAALAGGQLAQGSVARQGFADLQGIANRMGSVMMSGGF